MFCTLLIAGKIPWRCLMAGYVVEGGLTPSCGLDSKTGSSEWSAFCHFFLSYNSLVLIPGSFGSYRYGPGKEMFRYDHL